MNEFWTLLMPHVIDALAPLVGAVLSALAGLALHALRVRFKNESANRVFDRLERVVAMVVLELERTVVPRIREAAEDGRITPDEADELVRTAIAKVKHILGTSGFRELERSGTDIEALVVSIIEAKVADLRLRQSQVPPRFVRDTN